MKVRIASKGWENFSGNLGFGLQFKDGVSVNDLTPRQIARVGATLSVVDADTGEQVGPAAVAQRVNATVINPIPEMKTAAQVIVEHEFDKAKLHAEEQEREAAEKAALAAAEEKAKQAAEEEIVFYSRQELEAIGANDGISGLREIAAPLGVKGRAINELVAEILAEQNKRIAG